MNPTWLPPDFIHPLRVALSTGHHLRPVRSTDVDLDMAAVMGSQERLWAIYGRTCGWPAATLTVEDERADLARHESAAVTHRSFRYALFDAGETELLGCVAIDPPSRRGDHDAEVSWWVVDLLVGGPVDEALGGFVPAWLSEHWPFRRPVLLGRDLPWNEWAALPPREAPPGQAMPPSGRVATTTPLVT